MPTHQFHRAVRAPRAVSLLAVCTLITSLFPGASLHAQQGEQTDQSGVEFRISSQAERLEMTINTSRILTLDKNVPRVFVNNPNVVSATPLSPTQVQVSGLQPGYTQLNLWDSDGQVYSVDVVVLRDARELTDLLLSEFPEAQLRVRPLSRSVYITGFVPRPEMVDEIIALAREYYPTVINGINLGGVYQVALHVKVMEVSRTKLRQLGLDWEFLSESGTFQQAAGGILPRARNVNGDILVPGIGGDTIRFSIFGDSSAFLGYLQALREDKLVKLLAEPTLVTMTGRPASFNSGGSFPILVPNGLATMSVQFRQYGTRVEFVPTVLGNGQIRLEVRPSVSELDPSRGVQANGIDVPGLTEREVDTAVEMRAGQTLALAGLIQNRVEATNRGVPLLGDLPWIGRAFSRVEERMNEVELLVMVTPEIVSAMDAHEVPQCGPGQLTGRPSDKELYAYGYIETPNCCLQGSPVPVDGTIQAAPGQPLTSEPTPDMRTSPRQEILPTPPAQATPPSGLRRQVNPLQGSPLQGAPRQPSSDNAPSNETARRGMYEPRFPRVRHAQPAEIVGPQGYDPLY